MKKGNTQIDLKLDPVFMSVGQSVYTYESLQAIRKDNLERKRNGKRIYNQAPQAGFQERVLLLDADVLIVGGKRGSGKTHIALFKALPYMFNPDVSMYGFRKFEDDVSRGIWKSSKQIYKGFATPVESNYEWHFLNNKGATMKMEHLQDPKKISDRFRGVEMAYILIEELPEHTKDNMNVLFDLLTSNRSTAGVLPRCLCTCNPVGKSNALRRFLDWYIDPDTDRIIPERDGQIRYFHRINDEDIVWGNTPEEVYNNPEAHKRIELLCEDTGGDYRNFITSLRFIEGDFAGNQILHVSDPKYMSRISARGGESTVNDISGVWRDVETGSNLVNMEDMEAFFNNNEKRDGFMRASADVALTGDFFVIWALDGHHICDLEAWRGGVDSDDVIPKIEYFLKRNGVRKENFTFDMNGLGGWLKNHSAFKSSIPFNNKSESSDNKLWGNLKSEACDKFTRGIKRREYSIDSEILERKFTDGKGWTFTIRERLMEERKALKRKDNLARFDIISKPQMKVEVGWSPDFIEGLAMVAPMFDNTKTFSRKGFGLYRRY